MQVNKRNFLLKNYNILHKFYLCLIEYRMWLDGLGKTGKVYFIGIGGVSMSALAKLLRCTGYQVSGSDAVCSETVETLQRSGIFVRVGKFEGEACEALKNAEIVVYTDAVSKTDGELAYARTAKKILLKRGELLALVSQKFSFLTAVAGSHGKTTCTAMCAHVLKAVRVPFAAHIGGEDARFGNFYINGFEHFLTEACEYKKNLLSLTPDRAIVLNVDLDHMECYDGEEDLINTFRTFCQKAKTAFVCADDKRSEKLGDFPTFGIKNPFADYRAVDLKQTGERYSFTVAEYGRELCRIRLSCVGFCNVYNALATFSTMRSYGFDAHEIAHGIESFTAVKRRYEEIGKFRGGSFICDYAHHPKEIASTVATAQKATKRRLFVVFQPHTYSRTKLLMEEFVKVLSPIRNLVIYQTYAAREKYDVEGSAQTLSQRVGSIYVENVVALKTFLDKSVKEGDEVLFLGAGDVYYVAKFVLKELGGEGKNV